MLVWATIFLGYDTKNKGNKSKNKQVEIRKAKSFVHQGNHPTKPKKSMEIGENISQKTLLSNKTLIYKVYKEIIQVISNDTNNMNRKWTEDINELF